MIIPSYFVPRILITVVWFSLFNNDISLLLLVISLIFLDSLDGGKYRGTTFEYQKYDKIVDLLSYIIFLAFFKNRFDIKTFNILIISLIWRTIGVIKFYETNDNKYLHYHMDVFKEIVFLYLLIPEYNPLEVILIIIGKWIFEKYHHNKKYA
jgi:hypothetical protein